MHTFPIMVPLPTTAPTSMTVPSPTSAASTTALDSTTTFFPSTVPSLLMDSLTCEVLRTEAMVARRLSASSSAPMPTPTFARSKTTQPSSNTTGANALLSLLCGCSTVLGPIVIGWVPVIWACWAMRTDESRTMEEGFGRRDVRFGAVDDRRFSAGREGAGCPDILPVLFDLQRERVGLRQVTASKTRYGVSVSPDHMIQIRGHRCSVTTSLATRTRSTVDATHAKLNSSSFTIVKARYVSKGNGWVSHNYALLHTSSLAFILCTIYKPHAPIDNAVGQPVTHTPFVDLASCQMR